MSIAEWKSLPPHPVSCANISSFVASVDREFASDRFSFWFAIVSLSCLVMYTGKPSISLSAIGKSRVNKFSNTT